MIKLLIIWLFGLLQHPKSDSLPEITSLNIAATKAVAADNTLFYVWQNILYLKTDTDTFSFLPQSNVLDIAMYGGLINAVLTQDQRLIVLDNKLNPLYDFDLSETGFIFPAKIKFCNGSQIAVYDQFDATLKIIDIPQGRVWQKYQLTGTLLDFDARGNRIFLLTADKLITIDLTTGNMNIREKFDCQSLTVYSKSLLLLCGEHLIVQDEVNRQIIRLPGRFKKIGGILQSGLLLQNPADSLFVLQLNVTGL